MNQELKHAQYEHIKKLEGLLAYAVKHDETAEAKRLLGELKRLIDSL